MDNKVTTAVNGIKSKARVQKHGEVFTPDSIVCDMHDGVTKNLFNDYKEDYEKKQLQAVTSLDDYIRDTYIEETYLEPTCGDGQFLIRILDKKLEYVNKVPVERREIALVQAVSTIYGIDIQADNVAEARARLERYLFDGQVETFDVGGKQVEREFTKVEGVELTDGLKRVLSNIIHNNIIVGNMLETDDIKNEKTDTNGNIIVEYPRRIPRIVGYDFNDDGTVLIEYCKLTDMENEDIKTETLGKINYLDIPVITQEELVKNINFFDNIKLTEEEKILTDEFEGLEGESVDVATTPSNKPKKSINSNTKKNTSKKVSTNEEIPVEDQIKGYDF